MTARQALWGLVVVSTLLRVLWAGFLGPGYDETYHSLFVLHPDLSYFDHPPMMVVVEAAGWLLRGGTASVLALRAGFVVLFAGSTLLMARLASRFYGAWAGTLAALILNVTAYYGLAASSFILPDGPLLFFWLLTLDRLEAALETPERLRAWVWVGLAWGGALLSKYHAVLLPVGTLLYIVTQPSTRSLLRKPGPYLAVAIGLVCFTPVLVWNDAHGWASFAFQGGRALGSDRIRLDGLLNAIAGQAFYLLPWIWVFLVISLVRQVRSLRAGQATSCDRFLLCHAAPPLVVFLGVACLRPVLPHWSLIGLLPVIPLAGRDWAALWPARKTRLAVRLGIVTLIPVVAAILVVIHARTGLFQQTPQGGLVAAATDPTGPLYGWDMLARELDRRGLSARPDTFLFTSRWYYSGQLAFALHNAVPVLCYNLDHAQNFAYWSRPEQWVGHDGIFVGINDCGNEIDYYAKYFKRVEPLGEYVVYRAGVPIRTAHLYRCVCQERPFPFGNSTPPPSLALAPSTRAQAITR
jgi:hypothetical protein